VYVKNSTEKRFGGFPVEKVVFLKRLHATFVAKTIDFDV